MVGREERLHRFTAFAALHPGLQHLAFRQLLDAGQPEFAAIAFGDDLGGDPAAAVRTPEVWTSPRPPPLPTA